MAIAERSQIIAAILVRHRIGIFVGQSLDRGEVNSVWEVYFITKQIHYHIYDV